MDRASVREIMSRLDPTPRNEALGNLDVCAARNFLAERLIDDRSAVPVTFHAPVVALYAVTFHAS